MKVNERQDGQKRRGQTELHPCWGRVSFQQEPRGGESPSGKVAESRGGLKEGARRDSMELSAFPAPWKGGGDG